jgi:hypothetical protein
MALDNLLWLGPEDVLGLGPQTEGVVARYQIDGQGIDLLLITFPSASQAAEAHSRLEGAALENLAATDVRDSTLGATFGQVAGETARDLIDKAMATLP